MKLCTFENFKNIVDVRSKRGIAWRAGVLAGARFNPTPGKQGRQIWEFQASLLYRTNSRPVNAAMRPCQKDEKKGR